MNILFIVTEINSANGICCQAIMDELRHQGHEVFCITNQEVNIPPNNNHINYFYVKPRLSYRLFKKAEKENNKIFKKLQYLTAKILNKLKLAMTITCWPFNSPLYSLRIYKTIKYVCNMEKIDVMIPVYTQIDTLIAAKKIKASNPDIKYYPYFLDSLSGGYGPKYFTRQMITTRGFKWEKFLVRNADRIFVMLSSKKHYQFYKNSINYYSKLRFLDLPLFIPFPQVNNRSELLSENKINLLYIGSIPSNIRNPQFFFDVFMNTSNSNFHLTIIGTNTCPALIEKAIKKDKRISVYPSINHDKALEAMKTADILVNLGNNSKYMTPSKIFEYMSAQKPIVSTAPIYEEPSIKYLEKYPNACILYENDKDIPQLAETLENFINENIGITVPIEKIRQSFYLNSPQCFIKYITS